MSECKTKLLSDNPTEDDAFGQHANVAKAIANLVDQEEEGKAVALFGSWGSGKSTVVQILTSLLRSNKKRCVFVFDAWAHQGDPLRRSFLEQQIIAMLAAGWIQGDKWQVTREKLARRLKITEIKQVPQLTERGVYFLVAALVAPVGLAAISAMTYTDLWIKIVALLVSLLPLIAIFGTQHLDAKPKAKTAPVDEGTTQFLSMFVKRFETSSRNETIETPEPTSIEFCEIFRKVLKEALADKERKLIIVIDN